MRLAARAVRIGLLSVYVTAFGTVAARAQELTKPLAPGGDAPSFSLPTLSGARQTLSVWCGKKLAKPYLNSSPHVVVLNFWATYCKPCQKEIPELMKFEKKHKEDLIKIFCISLDKEGASIVAPFVKEKGYTLPILFDPYKRTAQRYGVKSLPALVVVGPDGVVRFSSVGYSENVSLQKLLEKAMAAAKAGQNYFAAADEQPGESVEVKQDADDAEPAGAAISPRDKWRAVARVESGESAEDVSGELGVSPDEVRKWYNELKQAALEMWKTQQE